MPNLESILKDALVLDVNDRAALAERLLDSLDRDSFNKPPGEEQIDEAEIERIWADEAERRLEALESGETESIPAEAVHAKAEKLFR